MAELPDHHELRIVYWSTLIALLRGAHTTRFPNRSFGKDLQLLFVYGAAILAFSEGKTPTITSIARFLQLPHETTRRYLQTIVHLGLLTKNGRGYKPTERAGASPAHVPRRIERLFTQAARYFYL
jgi:predicted transcriptional regulator